MPTFNTTPQIRASDDDYGSPPPGGTRTIVEQSNEVTTTTITDSPSGSRSAQPPVTPANEPRYTQPSEPNSTMQTPIAQNVSSTTPAPATATPQTASADDPFQRGIQAERARIAELEQYNLPSCAAIVAAAKADGRTAAQISAECFRALAAGQHQGDRRADAGGLASVPSGDAPRGSTTRHVSGELTDEQKAFAALLKEKTDAKVAARRGRSIMSRGVGVN